MHGRKCRLSMVKPAERGGYMPGRLMTDGIKEAERRGNWDERERA